jgi:hypothetical protein
MAIFGLDNPDNPSDLLAVRLTLIFSGAVSLALAALGFSFELAIALVMGGLVLFAAAWKARFLRTVQFRSPIIVVPGQRTEWFPVMVVIFLAAALIVGTTYLLTLCWRQSV